MLVENQFGHGAKYSPIKTKIARLLRPKFHKIGYAPIPFDWSKGAGILNKTGKLWIENQGQSLSCGGFSKKRAIEIIRIVYDGVSERLSAKSIYSREYAKNGGMTLNALKDDIGVNLEMDVPSYKNGQPPTEDFMRDNSWITSNLKNDALKRAGLMPITVNIDIESISQAIRDYGVVIILIQGQNNGSWLTANPIPPSNNVNLWAHYMSSEDVEPITDGKKKIPFYQSWGTSIGLNGIQYIDEDYINSGYITDVIAFDTKESITSQKISIIQKLLVLYQQLILILQKK